MLSLLKSLGFEKQADAEESAGVVVMAREMTVG